MAAEVVADVGVRGGGGELPALIRVGGACLRRAVGVPAGAPATGVGSGAGAATAVPAAVAGATAMARYAV